MRSVVSAGFASKKDSPACPLYFLCGAGGWTGRQIQITSEVANTAMVLGLTPCLDPNHPITGQIFTWAYLGLEEHLHGVLTQMGKEVLRSGSLIPESAG